MPRVWGSSRRGGSDRPKHQYNGSRSGQFAMKPFGSSSGKSKEHDKYGIGGITTIDYGSQEAIVPEPNELNAHALDKNQTTATGEVAKGA
jgi:hypothetical protein